MNFNEYKSELISVLEKCDPLSWENCAKELEITWRMGKSVYIIGNGGSASTAQHFETDWLKGLNSKLGSNFKVRCLTLSPSLLTAFGNDLSFDEIFSTQLNTFGESDDCLVSITGSGRSLNVIGAIKTAKKLGIKTVTLSGFEGGIVKGISDFNIHVPSSNMQIIEDIHSIFGHFVLKHLKNLT